MQISGDSYSWTELSDVSNGSHFLMVFNKGHLIDGT